MSLFSAIKAGRRLGNFLDNYADLLGAAWSRNPSVPIWLCIIPPWIIQDHTKTPSIPCASDADTNASAIKIVFLQPNVGCFVPPQSQSESQCPSPSHHFLDDLSPSVPGIASFSMQISSWISDSAAAATRDPPPLDGDPSVLRGVHPRLICTLCRAKAIHLYSHTVRVLSL